MAIRDVAKQELQVLSETHAWASSIDARIVEAMLEACAATTIEWEGSQLKPASRTALDTAMSDRARTTAQRLRASLSATQLTTIVQFLLSRIRPYHD